MNRGLSGFHTGRAWIELDMKSLAHNVGVLRSLLPNSCNLMPAVKANAYGHGAVEISRELNRLGIRAFCVASAIEGAELRENGIEGDILVLGYTHPGLLHLLKTHHLTQTVVDFEYAETLNNYAGEMLQGDGQKTGYRFKVHIKIDTGMHRLGEPSDNIPAILKIFGFENLDITGAYTHLCVDDGDSQSDKEFSKGQIDTFCAVLSRIREEGYEIPKAHLQGSYGIFNHRGLSFDYARVGIALYGMLSTAEETEMCNNLLYPVLSVKARISMTRELAAGEALGYGLAFTAMHDMRIAVLSIGYADGVPRSLSCDRGRVLVAGRIAPVVGRICMDQMMVDITGIEGVRQGDIAVIIGKYGAAEISACEVAAQANTISNEILSRLGERLERQILT